MGSGGGAGTGGGAAGCWLGAGVGVISIRGMAQPALSVSEMLRIKEIAKYFRFIFLTYLIVTKWQNWGKKRG